MKLLPCSVLALASFNLASHAQSLLPPPPLALNAAGTFLPGAANWQPAGELAGNPRTDSSLTPAPGSGLLVNVPTAAAHQDLVTAADHGDADLDLDFLLPDGGKLGVLLQGRYPVPLDGLPALRAPGLWQRLHVEFRAPTLDAAGKAGPARFRRVTLNGFTVQENAEVAPVPSASNSSARGPLVIRGDSSVAIRRLALKPMAPGRLALSGENFRVYAGEFKKPGEYDGTAPTTESAKLDDVRAAFANRSALVVTGSFDVKTPGLHAFTTDSADTVRLLIDGQPVLASSARGSEPVTLPLTAGVHPFRLDQLRATAAGRPALSVTVEGPDFAPAIFFSLDGRAGPSAAANAPRPRAPLLIEPTDRIRLQRGFVPFEPKKRLYAINVGTPAGVHYAYDFETGSPLRLWRGSFLDQLEMWDGRGENQYAKPAGPALTLNARPTVALLESPAHDWPDEPERLWSSQGYTLEANGQPVFLSKLHNFAIRDRIAPTADGRGLTRTLEIKGPKADWQAWVLLAEDVTITRQPDGRGYIVGDRAYFLDFPADAPLQPVLRTRRGRQQLVVPLVGAKIDAQLIYSLVW